MTDEQEMELHEELKWAKIEAGQAHMMVEGLQDKVEHWQGHAERLRQDCEFHLAEIKQMREILRYIWAHGDENGKVPYSWGQEYAERFIKLAKLEWDRKDET